MSGPDDTEFDRDRQILTSDWTKAIVASALIGFVMEGTAYLMHQAFGLTGSSANKVGILLLFVTQIVTAVLSFAVYANRTAAVLRRRLPGFPTLTWYALHVLFGIALGATIAFFGIDMDTTSIEPTTAEVIAVAIGGAIAGGFLGFAVGALQALVLRKVARTVGTWIRWSTIGGTAFALFAIGFYIPEDRSIASEGLSLSVGFAIAVAAGLGMLPAVHRLQPR